MLGLCQHFQAYNVDQKKTGEHVVLTTFIFELIEVQEWTQKAGESHTKCTASVMDLLVVDFVRLKRRSIHSEEIGKEWENIHLFVVVRCRGWFSYFQILAADEGRFYWYSYVLEISWLPLAAGLAVKKISLVFESKSVIHSSSPAVPCRISTGNLIAAARIHASNVNMDPPQWLQRLAPVERQRERGTCKVDPIYQPLRSGRIWHKINF